MLLACRELGLRVLLLCLGHATTVICVPRSTSLHKSPVCMPKYTHSTVVRSEIKYIKSECLQLRVFRQERHELMVLLSLYLGGQCFQSSICMDSRIHAQCNK